MSVNIHLRGLDNQLIYSIKQAASEQKISINKFILNLLRQALGQRSRVYHDLDAFAGTWSDKEAKDFLKNISDFEQIDWD